MIDAPDAPTALSATPVDLRNPLFVSDPHQAYEALRSRGAVHRDTMGLWLLVNHADCKAVMQDTKISRDPRQWRNYAAIRPYLAESVLEKTVERFMLFNDAPMHTRIRQLVSAAFTPAAMRLIEEQVRATAVSMVAALPHDRPFDLLADFAQVFPIRVIADMLGLAPEDLAQTREWSDAISLVVEPAATRSLKEKSNQAAIEMTQYLQTEVARRRKQRGNTVLDMLLTAQDASGDLADDELIANLMLMFMAGHETTTNLLGNGMLTLLRHPDQLARLRANPELMPSAVEEILRFESPANVVARVTRAPLHISGVDIPAGELLYCLTGAANRDPSVFANPEQFDIGRTPNPHLSFGGGVHYCIGAPLARLEAAVAFEALLLRFPRLQLAQTDVQWRTLINLRGLTALPLFAQSATSPMSPTQTAHQSPAYCK
jgi:pimeloyl-[acyl-carrier protein] synthase